MQDSRLGLRRHIDNGVAGLLVSRSGFTLATHVGVSFEPNGVCEMTVRRYVTNGAWTISIAKKPSTISDAITVLRR
jgi:hypothetical protein